MIFDRNLDINAAIQLAKLEYHPTLALATGKVFWVCNTAVGDVAAGIDSVGNGTRTNPFKTIAYALTKCVADRGDNIIVKPGHNETMTAAGTITMSKAGVSIIGLGTGAKRASITYSTSTAASIDVTASNCQIINMRIVGTGIDALTAMINVSNSDFRLANCLITHANATNQAVLGILTTAAASRMVVEDCEFRGTSDAGTSTAIRLVGGSDIRIRRNIFKGAYTNTLGAIEVNTTAATELIIDNNLILNLTADAGSLGMTLTTSTGLVTNNRVCVNASDATATIGNLGVVTNMILAGNYVSSNVSQVGVLI